MSSFIVSCPHCNQVLEADDRLVGQTVECPSCGKPFAVDAPETPAPGPAPEVESPDGSITIMCQNCGQALEADASLVGKSLDCPVCGKPLSIEAPAAVKPETSPHTGGSRKWKIPGKAESPTDEPAASHVVSRNGRRWTVPSAAQPSSSARLISEPSRKKKSHIRVWAFLGVLLVAGIVGGIALSEPTSSSQKESADEQDRPEIKDLNSDPAAPQWIQSCKEPDFRDVMRFPDRYAGMPIFIQGKINQVVFPKSNDHCGNIWIEQDGDWKKEWIVVYDDERTVLPVGNMLKGDKVCVFGTFKRILDWTNTNALNAEISGRAPMLMASLISNDEPDEVVRSYLAKTTTGNQRSPHNPTEAEKRAIGRVVYIYVKMQILMPELISSGHYGEDAKKANFVAGLESAQLLLNVDTTGCPPEFTKAWESLVRSFGELIAYQRLHALLQEEVAQARRRRRPVDKDHTDTLRELRQRIPEAQRACEKSEQAFLATWNLYGKDNVVQWSMEAKKLYDGNPNAKLFKSDR